MDSYVARMTRAVKTIDRTLYCKRNPMTEKVYVMKEAKKVKSYLMEDNSTLHVAYTDEYQVMALTHNWSVYGESVPWGEVPILERLREIDRHNKADLVRELELKEEKRRESERRHMRGEAEAFFSDYRREFMKSFSDVNTSNMDKSKDVRRKYDKRLKE